MNINIIITFYYAIIFIYEILFTAKASFPLTAAVFGFMIPYSFSKEL